MALDDNKELMETIINVFETAVVSAACSEHVRPAVVTASSSAKAALIELARIRCAGTANA